MSLALRALVAILAGSLLHLMAPPLNLHYLHWVAYLPMFWVLRSDRPRSNRWLGYLYGVVGVGLIFRWFVDTIILFSNLPTALAWACLLLFSMAFGLPYAVLWGAVHPLRQRLGSGWVLALPALLVLIEYASMFLLLFPYQQGVSQYRVSTVFQLASVTGVWGVSFLLMLFNAALAEALYRWREGRRPPVVVLCGAASAVALVLLFGSWRFQRVEQLLSSAPIVRTAQLQWGATMLDRMRMPARDEITWWIEQTRALPPGEADLVVWSEGACPYRLNEGRTAAVLGQLATRGRFDMVVGGGSRERRKDVNGVSQVTAFNSVYFFPAEGGAPSRYDKMVPLPFGEYLPLAETFPWIADLIQGPGNFGAGEEAVTFVGADVRIASPICYEGILSYVCRRFDAPDLFVNITNDAWFGDTAAPHQHAMLAAIRAMELGVPVVRSAYSGVSMVIEPHGRIHSETEPFEDVRRIVPVRSALVPTIYGMLGDWFVLLCALGLGGAMYRSRRKGEGESEAEGGG